MGTGCVQIAKNLKARVIACASSPEKLERLKELGADHVIDYTKEDFSQAGVGALGQEGRGRARELHRRRHLGAEPPHAGPARPPAHLRRHRRLRSARPTSATSGAARSTSSAPTAGRARTSKRCSSRWSAAPSRPSSTASSRWPNPPKPCASSRTARSSARCIVTPVTGPTSAPPCSPRGTTGRVRGTAAIVDLSRPGAPREIAYATLDAALRRRRRRPGRARPRPRRPRRHPRPQPHGVRRGALRHDARRRVPVPLNIKLPAESLAFIAQGRRPVPTVRGRRAPQGRPRRSRRRLRRRLRRLPEARPVRGRRARARRPLPPALHLRLHRPPEGRAARPTPARPGRSPRSSAPAA